MVWEYPIWAKLRRNHVLGFDLDMFYTLTWFDSRNNLQKYDADPCQINKKVCQFTLQH